MFNDDLFISKCPTIDVHGEFSSSMEYIVNTFVSENVKKQINRIVIIHGIGNDILRKEIARVLSLNKYVDSFGTGIYNKGQTIINLIVDK